MSRIGKTFDRLKASDQAGFIPFIMAGDPTPALTLTLMHGLAARGADLIELGVAFTDPMADGPAIEAAGLRAIDGGQTLTKTIDLVREFRKQNEDTPIILMGYYNPFYAYGVDRFLADAKAAGVDGLIIVDLPPEEDPELCIPARAAGIDFIRLATPTTDAERLPEIVKNTSGFVYYVSVSGVTGRSAGVVSAVEHQVSRLGESANLPVAVGFGVKTPDHARSFAKIADAVVVGSALVDTLARGLEDKPQDTDNSINAVLNLAGDIAQAVHTARQ